MGERSLYFFASRGRTSRSHEASGPFYTGLTAGTWYGRLSGEAPASSRKLGCSPRFAGSLMLFTKWVFWTVAVFVVCLGVPL